MNNKYLKQGIIEVIESKLSSKKSRATIEKKIQIKCHFKIYILNIR